MFAGIGYFEDNPYGPLERMYRDCRAMWLEEGPRTVQRLTISRKLIASDGVI
ncbi:acyl-CoA dehydrogenase family protein [Clostridium estertheticum]|uniref:acyl-CoA dehydrogenase family protein n=1 Tax=Clostridium estertheticum TaxID=238834 RepID=UPI0035CD1C62